MYYLLISVPLVVLIHLLTTAFIGILLKIKLTEFSYGFGPVLGRHKAFVLKLFPLGGYVRFLDSRDDCVGLFDYKYALNRQPRFVRVFLALSGCTILIVLSSFFLGSDVFVYCVETVQYFILGALDPFGYAQGVIESILEFTSNNRMGLVFTCTVVAFSSINLLPFVPLNGGQAILDIFDSNIQKWPIFSYLGLTIILAGYLSWLFAICLYYWQ